MSEVQKHFDHIAPEYDSWKRKNWYYYDAVKRIYRGLIPVGAKVLEIGCGTGEILAELKPARGVGIDISEEMIKRAAKKYAGIPQLEFHQGNAASFVTGEHFDFIFLADVIEHLEDVMKSIANISRMAKPGASVIVSMANPLWEPVLELSEKFGMKMPEGPHERIPVWRLIGEMRRNQFELRQSKYFLPFPKYIPFFSHVFNAVVEHIPFLNRTGVIAVFVFVKDRE
ncbi:MAG: hypothetical protein A2934_03705 [Candidatus Sungbacteria bacterium RIFCSPLOWO2_01_FULL_47_10]|uniref:Methyltransferase type 11 domain-containing protein n=1 Tax=Candidatus Sungbacteria bacterium RIFCSPLOWO2_01_FULL_47_10 TaxID=1802276 RepID=A0A1G2L8G4_9BACT|nr:MAG: hypothetical protein A2934_03705 [Candidatus Sungbacteria bacterium RIFCSPLOWO2_01_FULL_47_10]